jgi:hypothetical protein
MNVIQIHWQQLDFWLLTPNLVQSAEWVYLGFQVVIKFGAHNAIQLSIGALDELNPMFITPIILNGFVEMEMQCLVIL